MAYKETKYNIEIDETKHGSKNLSKKYSSSITLVFKHGNVFQVSRGNPVLGASLVLTVQQITYQLLKKSRQFNKRHLDKSRQSLCSKVSICLNF
jgi:hypothetical protein